MMTTAPSSIRRTICVACPPGQQAFEYDVATATQKPAKNDGHTVYTLTCPSGHAVYVHRLSPTDKLN